MLLIIFRSNLCLAHCIKRPPTDAPNGRGNFISITSASISEWPWDKSTDSVQGRKKSALCPEKLFGNRVLHWAKT